MSYNTHRGIGQSFASFGEVVQGRLSSGEDFQVTLPVNLWSHCEATCVSKNGPLSIKCDLYKSQAIVERALRALGINHGFEITININSDIPVGKGLSSSTADMLATIRAIEDTFSTTFNQVEISSMLTTIEPHDALHYNNSVMYNHRSGYLIRDLAFTPQFTVISADSGGAVDTVAYNQNIAFDQFQMIEFDALIDDLLSAFKDKDSHAIAACATRSSQMHVKATGNKFLQYCLDTVSAVGAIGLQATHSGTCSGFLFPGDLLQEDCRAIKDNLQSRLGKEILIMRSLP